MLLGQSHRGARRKWSAGHGGVALGVVGTRAGALVDWLAAWCARVDGRLNAYTEGKVRLIIYEFLEQPVPADPSGAGRADRTRHPIVSLFDADERLVSPELPVSEMTARFARGDVCLAAFSPGDDGAEGLAGHVWLTRDAYFEKEANCIFVLSPATRVWWDYHLFVSPRFRGGRLFLRLWEAAQSLLSDRGVVSTISQVSWTNQVSRRSHRRLGARPIGWAVILRFFRCTAVLSPSLPWLRFSHKRPVRVTLHSMLVGSEV